MSSNKSFWEVFTSPFTYSATALMTDIFILITLIITFFLCWSYKGNTPQGRQTNLLALIMGLLFGCFIATIAVPYNTFERNLYGGIGTAVGAFISGYVVSKVDGVWNLLLYQDDEKKSLNWAFLKFVAFVLMGTAMSSSLILANRTEWISMAIQCNPGLYSGKSSRELEDILQPNWYVCWKLDLPQPPKRDTKQTDKPT